MKDFLSEIITRVGAEKKSLADTVTAGSNINSFEDYKWLIGRIDGLQQALDIRDNILTENDEEN